MRIAALYDIHGNAPALEAVLRDVEESGVDGVVVGGDVVPGPLPLETLALLLDLPLPLHWVRGNGEADVLSVMRGRDPATLHPQARGPVTWTAARLGPGEEALLAAWPATVDIGSEGGGRTLFCHATPGSDEEIFTRATPEARLLPLFAGCGATLVVCGHTHMHFDRRVGDVRVVNAGSVGMPFGPPGAYWLLLDRGVEFRRTAYDLGEAARRVRASDYPWADAFAEGSILAPPPEAEMVERFERTASERI